MKAGLLEGQELEAYHAQLKVDAFNFKAGREYELMLACAYLRGAGHPDAATELHTRKHRPKGDK